MLFKYCISFRNNKQILKLYQASFVVKKMNRSEKLKKLNENVHENIFYSISPKGNLKINFKETAFGHHQNSISVCHFDDISLQSYSFPKKYTAINEEHDSEKIQKEIDNREKEINAYSKRIKIGNEKLSSLEDNFPISENFVKNFPLIKITDDKTDYEFSFYSKSKRVKSNLDDLNAHILEKVKNTEKKSNMKFDDNELYAILDKKKGFSLFNNGENQERLCEICEGLEKSLNEHFKEMKENDFLLLHKSAVKNSKTEAPLKADGLVNIYSEFAKGYKAIKNSVEMFGKNRNISSKLIAELILEKSLRTIKEKEEVLDDREIITIDQIGYVNNNEKIPYYVGAERERS